MALNSTTTKKVAEWFRDYNGPDLMTPDSKPEPVTTPGILATPVDDTQIPTPKTPGIPATNLSSPSPQVKINTGGTSGTSGMQGTQSTGSTNTTTPATWSGTGPRPDSDPGPTGPDPGNMWDSPGARAARGLPPLTSQAATGTTTATMPPGSTTGQAIGPGILNTQGTTNLPQWNDPSSYAIGGVNYGLPPPQNTVPTDTTGTVPGDAVTGTPGAPTTPATGIPGAPAAPAKATQGILNYNGSTTINSAALTHREIDPELETVQGQMNGLLKKGSPYLSDARARAERQAGQRGLSNSTMAGTGGEEAAIAAALNIATPDAAAYNAAGNYNAALENQALMYNVDTQNQYQLQSNTIAGQKAVAEIGAAAQMGAAGISAAAHISAASIAAEGQRFAAQLQDSRSKYNTDMNYKASQDHDHTTLVNNIMNNMDMDPKIKSGQLNALGETGLAKAIYPDEELNFEGDTSTTGGKNYVFNNGSWTQDTHKNGDVSTYQGVPYVYQDGKWIKKT